MFKSAIILFAIAVALQDKIPSVQSFDFGSCPEIEAKSEFDLNSYQGTWYEYGTWGAQTIQGEGKCVKSVYYLNADTGQIEFSKTQRPISISAHPEVHGNLKFQHPTIKDGKLLLTANVPVFGKVTVPLWVLGTDYKSWAVTYSCMDSWLFHFKSVWITTRKPNPSERFDPEVDILLNKVDLTINHLKRTDQKDCGRDF